jgi:MFS family permease
MAGAVIGYAGLSFFGVAWETAIQDHVPHRSLGKVASWDQLTSFIAMPLGNALAGPLSQAYGTDPVLVICGLVLLGSGVAPLLASGVRSLTHVVAAPVAAGVDL